MDGLTDYSDVLSMTGKRRRLRVRMLRLVCNDLLVGGQRAAQAGSAGD